MQPLLVQREVPLNTNCEGNNGARHDEWHDPTTGRQGVKHKETSLQTSEYTDPLYSAPDTVLAGIYGNYENVADHIRGEICVIASFAKAKLHLQPR